MLTQGERSEPWDIKKQTITLFAAILLIAVGAAAQKLSYQAVVRNDANELVAETTVYVAVSVLNANNAVQYAEIHTNVQTNSNGLLYNWNAAADTFNTAYGETSVDDSYSNAVSVTFNGHRRGISFRSAVFAIKKK